MTAPFVIGRRFDCGIIQKSLSRHPMPPRYRPVADFPAQTAALRVNPAGG